MPPKKHDESTGLDSTNQNNQDENELEYVTTDIQAKTCENTRLDIIKIPKERLEKNTLKLLKYNKDLSSSFLLIIAFLVPLVQDTFTDLWFFRANEIKAAFLAFFILSIFSFGSRLLTRFDNEYLNVDEFLLLCEDNHNYEYKNLLSRVIRFLKKTFKITKY
jgi:hypothetical protein